MSRAAYMRRYRRDNPDYYQRMLAKCVERYWEDPEAHRKYNNEKKAQERANARVARRTLRSLMRVGSRTANLIKGRIDIESASDAVVARFFRRFIAEYENAVPKRK